MTQKSLLQSAGDGTAVPAGYVGEKRTATITAVNVGSGAVDVATLSLSPGVWIVTCNISIGLGSGAGATRHVFNCPANDDGLISSATSFAERATATATVRATAGVVRYVNTSSTITYSIQAQSQNATVVYPLTTSDTFLHAVRIA